MPRIKDQAVCIRLIDWSETSQIVAVLTREYGKVRGIAKGSKRMSPSSIARFSGGIELLTAGQIVANLKPSVELAAFLEWDLQEPWWHLRQDLEAHRLALYAADVVHAMLPELEPHAETFDALSVFLPALVEKNARQVSLLRFQWAFLVDCGYRPEPDVDSRTNQPLPPARTYHFDARGGGVTTATDIEGAWGVRHQTVELLRLADRGALPDDADAEGCRRANRLLCAYLRTLLDRELPTMPFILA